MFLKSSAILISWAPAVRNLISRGQDQICIRDIHLYTWIWVYFKINNEEKLKRILYSIKKCTYPWPPHCSHCVWLHDLYVMRSDYMQCHFK